MSGMRAFAAVSRLSRSCPSARAACPAASWQTMSQSSKTAFLSGRFGCCVVSGPLTVSLLCGFPEGFVVCSFLLFGGFSLFGCDWRPVPSRALPRRRVRVVPNVRGEREPPSPPALDCPDIAGSPLARAAPRDRVTAERRGCAGPAQPPLVPAAVCQHRRVAFGDWGSARRTGVRLAALDDQPGGTHLADGHRAVGARDGSRRDVGRRGGWFRMHCRWRGVGGWRRRGPPGTCPKRRLGGPRTAPSGRRRPAPWAPRSGTGPRCAPCRPHPGTTAR